jgi:hypothetical protein
MEIIGWAFAAPGLLLALAFAMPFFAIHEWWVHGMPFYVKGGRSIVQQWEINEREGKLTPQQRFRRWRKGK